MIKIVVYICGVLACSLLSPVIADQRYQARVDQASWAFSQSQIRCELNHEIPRYGTAQFVASAGGELAFVMNVLQPALQDGMANMRSVAPFWLGGGEQDVAELTLSKGETIFYVSQVLARRMLYELEAGHFPVFKFKDFADQTQQIEVALSAVRFQEVLPKFQHCITQLLPYGIEGVENINLRFEVDNHRLNRAELQELEEIALFAASSKDAVVHIDGHADSDGTDDYNQQLSMKRAYTIRNYLVEQGVDPKRIRFKAYGETQPVSSNKTAEGKAANRRAEVVLTTP